MQFASRLRQRVQRSFAAVFSSTVCSNEVCFNRLEYLYVAASPTIARARAAFAALSSSDIVLRLPNSHQKNRAAAVVKRYLSGSSKILEPGQRARQR